MGGDVMKAYDAVSAAEEMTLLNAELTDVLAGLRPLVKETAAMEADGVYRQLKEAAAPRVLTVVNLLKDHRAWEEERSKASTLMFGQSFLRRLGHIQEPVQWQDVQCVKVLLEQTCKSLARLLAQKAELMVPVGM